MEQLPGNTREWRRPVSGKVACAYGSGELASAAWRDVSRDGASIELGRYLRPGRRLTLRFAAPWDASSEMELEACVAWCRTGPDTRRFLAGLRVLRDQPEAAVAFAALGYGERAATNKANTEKVLADVRHSRIAPNLELGITARATAAQAV